MGDCSCGAGGRVAKLIFLWLLVADPRGPVLITVVRMVGLRLASWILLLIHILSTAHIRQVSEVQSLAQSDLLFNHVLVRAVALLLLLLRLLLLLLLSLATLRGHLVVEVCSRILRQGVHLVKLASAVLGTQLVYHIVLLLGDDIVVALAPDIRCSVIGLVLDIWLEAALMHGLEFLLLFHHGELGLHGNIVCTDCVLVLRGPVEEACSYLCHVIAAGAVLL